MRALRFISLDFVSLGFIGFAVLGAQTAQAQESGAVPAVESTEVAVDRAHDLPR